MDNIFSGPYIDFIFLVISPSFYAFLMAKFVSLTIGRLHSSSEVLDSFSIAAQRSDCEFVSQATSFFFAQNAPDE